LTQASVPFTVGLNLPQIGPAMSGVAILENDINV